MRGTIHWSAEAELPPEVIPSGIPRDQAKLLQDKRQDDYREWSAQHIPYANRRAL